MDGLDLLKTFREVAARGSFSRAATVLGMSKAASASTWHNSKRASACAC